MTCSHSKILFTNNNYIFQKKQMQQKELYCHCKSNAFLNRDGWILPFAFAFIPLLYIVLVVVYE